VEEFVSESEVRTALAKSAKIYIGPKTIVTPAARDLADSNKVFVVTDIAPASTKKSRSAS
jgi:ethanolamine utilization cobalamin adenosyltransferase